MAGNDGYLKMKYNGQRGWKSAPLGAPSDRPAWDAAAVQPDEEDGDNLPDPTNVSLDCILGTSHYLPPSNNQNNQNHTQPDRSPPDSSSLRAKYPFHTKVRPSIDPRHATRLLQRLTDQKNTTEQRHPHPQHPKKHNALHILGAQATTPAIKEDSVNALWEEWVDGERQEKNSYKSIALECERRMSKAAVLSKHHGSPNSLRTAVAFDCLDQLGKVFGRYGAVFDTLRSELEQSIYVDGILSSQQEMQERTDATTVLMDKAEAHHHRRRIQEEQQHNIPQHQQTDTSNGSDDEEEEDPEVLYGQRVTYFEQSTLLEAERSRILNMANELRVTLEEWELNKETQSHNQDKQHHHSHPTDIAATSTATSTATAGHVWAELLERGRHENKVCLNGHFYWQQKLHS